MLEIWGAWPRGLRATPMMEIARAAYYPYIVNVARVVLSEVNCMQVFFK